MLTTFCKRKRFRRSQGVTLRAVIAVRPSGRYFTLLPLQRFAHQPTVAHCVFHSSLCITVFLPSTANCSCYSCIALPPRAVHPLAQRHSVSLHRASLFSTTCPGAAGTSGAGMDHHHDGTKVPKHRAGCEGLLPRQGRCKTKAPKCKASGNGPSS